MLAFQGMQDEHIYYGGGSGSLGPPGGPLVARAWTLRAYRRSRDVAHLRKPRSDTSRRVVTRRDATHDVAQRGVTGCARMGQGGM